MEGRTDENISFRMNRVGAQAVALPRREGTEIPFCSEWRLLFTVCSVANADGQMRLPKPHNL